jgi:hypothetical protein
VIDWSVTSLRTMSTIITREQLYQRAWATPIDTLRKEFGISNVGLGKTLPSSRDSRASRLLGEEVRRAQDEASAAVAEADEA